MNYCKTGIFGTVFKKPKRNSWAAAYESTFGDYLGMKEGDRIYFFFKRKIYGVGELISVGKKVQHLNYPESYSPHPQIKKHFKKIIDNEDIRIIVTFKASPLFFKKGVDMDLVLQSNPEAFKMLRAMWKVSFIKVDDKEDNALFDVLLRENKEDFLEKNGIVTENLEDSIKKILQQDNYRFSANNMIKGNVNQTSITHEMIIECDIIEKLVNDREEKTFGKWDYVSHQVVASPFKPIDYMDKIDIFGYEKIQGYESISRYACIEVKKGNAENDLITQVMKYVDWIKDEYAHGDYSMVEAFVVARQFSKEVIEYAKKIWC